MNGRKHAHSQAPAGRTAHEARWRSGRAQRNDGRARRRGHCGPATWDPGHAGAAPAGASRAAAGQGAAAGAVRGRVDTAPRGAGGRGRHAAHRPLCAAHRPGARDDTGPDPVRAGISLGAPVRGGVRRARLPRPAAKLPGYRRIDRAVRAVPERSRRRPGHRRMATRPGLVHRPARHHRIQLPGLCPAGASLRPAARAEGGRDPGRPTRSRRDRLSGRGVRAHQRALRHRGHLLQPGPPARHAGRGAPFVALQAGRPRPATQAGLSPGARRVCAIS